MEYILLCFIWIGWCCIHSGMISVAFIHQMKSLLGVNYKYYRVLFNFIALLTFVPAYLYSMHLRGEVLITWPGGLEFLRYIILLLSLALFAAGAKKYDMLQFLGYRQIISGDSHLSLSATDSLDTKGILHITRHPWYLAALLFIWSIHAELYLSTIIVKGVLTAYLFIGTLLEERKLIAEYGSAYLEYTKKVSMLFPTKWILTFIFGISEKTDHGK